MALGPFAGGFGQGLGLGARLGLQGMEDLRLREQFQQQFGLQQQREARLAKLDEQQQFLGGFQVMHHLAKIKDRHLRNHLFGVFAKRYTLPDGQPMFGEGAIETFSKMGDESLQATMEVLNANVRLLAGMSPAALSAVLNDPIEAVEFVGKLQQQNAREEATKLEARKAEAMDTHRQAQLAEQARHHRTQEGISGGHLAIARQELAQGRRPSETEANLDRMTELETGGQVKSYAAAPMDVKQRVAERGQQLAVERQAPKTLPTGLIEDLRDTEKAVLQVKAQARDYKPEYTGPTHGRIAEWINDPLGYTSDEEYRWSIGVQSLNNRYISKYMGATVPPAEFARAKAVLINRTDTPQAVRQKLRVMQDELQADLTASRNALRTGGYGQMPALRGGVEVIPGTTVEEIP